MKNVWWVNQNRTYEAERDGAYIWAPLLTSGGASVEHHSNLTQIRAGDVTLHYVGAAIQAIGFVREEATGRARPGSSDDAREGNLVRVEYHPLLEPIPLQAINGRNEKVGPFDIRGKGKQGYAFAVAAGFARQFHDQFSERWPIEWMPETERWDEYVAWVGRCIENRDAFDHSERDYKFRLSALLSEARESLSADDAGWPGLLARALKSGENNIIDWRAYDNFLKWVSADTALAGQALEHLWKGPDVDTQAVTEFLTMLRGVVPPAPAITIASVLLMAWNTTRYPPYRVTAFKSNYQLVGYPGAPADAASGDIWQHAMGFLDRIKDEANKRGVDVSDRLDAQGAVWIMRQSSGADYWSNEEKRLFAAYRGDSIADGDEAEPETVAGHAPVSGGEPASVQYWKIAPGRYGGRWQTWLSESHCSVAWDELGDLSGLSREQFQKRAEPIAEELEWGKGFEQAWRFCQIPINSLVVANRGTTEVLGIGRVTGPYYFEPDVEHGHRLPVEWYDTTLREVNQGGWRRTMVQLPPATFTALSQAPPLPASPQPPQIQATESSERRVPFSIEEETKGLFMSRDSFEGLLRTLDRKKNLILQGPPGVGKTFVARRLANAFIGFRSADHVTQVQFHQSYAYEDFIEGWRPQESGGFALHRGIFRRFVDQALRAPDEKFVFIIDEINRGNLSKVFGELMMLIEGDKRGREFELPLTYSQAPFYVPDNVYVIGTMNTADRSLAMMDYALRRRFAFHNLAPEFHSDAFSAHLLEAGVEDRQVRRIRTSMTRLNEEIQRQLGAGFVIGHSFFSPEQTVHPTWLAEVLHDEIRPLLEEYFFDNLARVPELLRLLDPDDDDSDR